MNQVTLDKKRAIRFNYYVISQIEKDTGKSFLNFDPEGLTVGDCIIMAYHGCKAADKEFNLSIEEVGEFTRGETFTEVFTAFTEDMIRANEAKK